jgi:hypothetical protein
VVDATASFAAPVMEGKRRREVKRRRVEAAPEELRGRGAAGSGAGLLGVSVVAPSRSRRKGRKSAALLAHALQSFKPGVFEEALEMLGGMWHF